MGGFEMILLILDSTLRLAVPLILCAMAGMFSERAGVVDIGLEGKMLAGAFAAAATAYTTGSAWLGLVVAMLVSMCFSLVHGFASITHRGNQVVSGMAINILVSGTTLILAHAWFQRGGRTPTVPNDARFLPIEFWGAETLGNIPIIGQIYAEILSGHNIIVYLTFAVVALSAWVLYRTRFGLRLRAVGENPAAVDTAGISVTWLRYRAVIICGLLCGIAGAYLSTAQGANFLRDMTAGQGYIALAALIFGKWRPVLALYACLLFGLLRAIAIRMQGVEVAYIGEIPVQFIEALPYILTVILLAGFIGKAVAPKAIGVPYVKER